MTKRVLAVLGAVVLSVGAFMPITGRRPMELGFQEALRVLEYFDNVQLSELKQTMDLFEVCAEARYYDTEKWEGVALVLVVALAALAALFGLGKTLWLTAVGTLGCVGLSFVNLVMGRAKILRDFADTPELGQKVVESIYLRWGWWVLLAGVALVLVAAAVPARPHRRHGIKNPPRGWQRKAQGD